MIYLYRWQAIHAQLFWWLGLVISPNMPIKLWNKIHMIKLLCFTAVFCAVDCYSSHSRGLWACEDVSGGGGACKHLQTNYIHESGVIMFANTSYHIQNKYTCLCFLCCVCLWYKIPLTNSSNTIMFMNIERNALHLISTPLTALPGLVSHWMLKKVIFCFLLELQCLQFQPHQAMSRNHTWRN